MTGADPGDGDDGGAGRGEDDGGAGRGEGGDGRDGPSDGGDGSDGGRRDGDAGPFGAVRFRDRAAYLPGPDALVLADLHVGRDETSRVELPMGERTDLPDRLGALLDRFDPAEVVLAGDVLHSFGDLPRGATETLAALRGTARRAGAELVYVRGNHDAMLPRVTDRPVHDEYRLGDGGGSAGGRSRTSAGGPDGDGESDEDGGVVGADGSDGGGTVVCHGHDPPEAGADRYVVGHDHPAIEIEGRRRPCYLIGEDAHRGAAVLVLPAFNRLPAGTALNGARDRDLQSPLVTDLDRFRPVVRDEDADETYRFPPLGEFRRML